ncbi:shufflon protein C' domain protein [Escherichia coli 3030-1]|nr:shufflon protein C' domain protein [Escherichia coli 3030-1]
MLALLAYVPIRSVVRGNKINYSACNWYKSSVAMNHFIGGKSGGSIYYKPIQCPTGYIMTGTRMYGIGDGVDEEQCRLPTVAPLIMLQHQED